MKFRSIDDVVAWRCCVGCGGCSYLAGRSAIRMRNVEEAGYRPERTGVPPRCKESDLLAICPGAGTNLAPDPAADSGSEKQRWANGPVVAAWEGFATDEKIRHAGSSGGALTALAAYSLEKGRFHGVLHIGQDPDHPLENRTVLSRTTSQLRRNSGSRYSPASVCEGLDLVENAPSPCVVIGQPSEIAALRMLQKQRPELDRKVGVALSFFCAGSPPTQGTAELLKERGIDPSEVTDLRYRGNGWPGHFAVRVKGKEKPVVKMTYAESWAYLQKFRPWSVQIWPDGSGEHADVTCGDPWYREVLPGEAGSSLVVARTEAGREFVEEAVANGYLSLEPLDSERLIASQENLIAKKGAVWGRLWTMRLLGMPAPRHDGYGLRSAWWRLPVREKIASFVGTARRILARGYRVPAEQSTREGATGSLEQKTGAGGEMSS